MAGETLEDFALKSLDLGRLTGVSLAIHAIPDGFLLLHVGVGCKHKATTQLSTHDLSRGVVAREAWTEVGDIELIRGATDRLGPYIRSWCTRLDPAFMVVCSATFLELTGEDIAQQVERAAATVDADVAWVHAPGDRGDLYVGYADTVLEICKRIDWDRPAKARTVALVGQMFDRYEGDQTGNLQQIRNMLKGVGLVLGPVLLSGAPYASLHDAGTCEVVVQMPYMEPAQPLERTIGKRPIVKTDLPMGFAGSARWLRLVAKAAGAPTSLVERFLAGREKAARKQLAPVSGLLRGQRVAVIADLPLAAGTSAVLTELGLDVVLVGVRGQSLGGADQLRDTMQRYGVSLRAEVLDDPSVALVRSEIGELVAHGRLDGVLGSATDLNAIATLPPRTLLRQTPSGRVHPAGPFTVEIGFPCKRYHVLRPAPVMGPAGMLVWAERLISAPRLWDSGRESVR